MDYVETAAADMISGAKERERVSRIFGQVRAEYASDEEIFRLFATPAYWAKLIGARPCFLVGGRGTGKTTALRGLSFRGQYSLNGPDITTWASVGAYLRMETNVVSAFRGKRRTEEEWSALFAHYINLQLSARIVEFLEWREETLGKVAALRAEHVELFAVSLGIDSLSILDEAPPSLVRLHRLLALQSGRLELALNNPRTIEGLSVSLLGVPMGHLLDALRDDADFKGRQFLFAVDEYENLQPYQQAVINTLIKHVGDHPYTIKVGVRDSEGWNRETLAPAQYLTAPADFEVVDIVNSLSDKTFNQFARSICSSRLLAVAGDNALKVPDLFPILTIAEEAELLGLQTMLDRALEDLILSGAEDDDLARWQGLPRLQQAMVPYWAESTGRSAVDVLQEALSRPRQWETRTSNYSYALLFTIRRRVRGVRKYYAGWSVFMRLASGNIRYALQLIHEAISMHLDDGNSLRVPISPETQTRAASSVGHRMLRELKGSSAEGGSLTRLALGLGRVFGVMAAEPHGHAPEVNQFRVDRGSSLYDDRATDRLLREAVAQGCLVSFAGNKRASVSGETAEFDYRLHPVFSAYFVVGHRSKRRMVLRAADLLALASDRTGTTVSSLIRDSGVRKEQALPPQLALYGDVFDED